MCDADCEAAAAPARRTLYAFDFDRTLVLTHDSSKWEELTGAPWTEGNWFADARSLAVHSPGPAMAAYFEAVKDDDAVIVIHTGRAAVMREPVLALLATYGVTRFHEAGFCTKRRKALKQKVGRLMALIAAHDIGRVVLYDDKQKNVERFRAIAADVPKGVTVEVYHVGPAADAADEDEASE